jgi:hypothetical protein
VIWPQNPIRVQIYVQRTIIYKDDVISDDAQLQESLKKSRASHRGRKPKKMKDSKFKCFRDRVDSQAPHPFAWTKWPTCRSRRESISTWAALFHANYRDDI